MYHNPPGRDFGYILVAMNPLPPEIWDRGLSYAAYRRTVRRNGKIFDEVNRAPDYTEEDLEFLRKLPPLKVLAIGEDWCPDVYHTLPTWVRAAEKVPGWELRIYARDSNLEVMSHFLWMGQNQRIPVYAFYDEDNHLQTWWSGRSAVAQRAFDEALAGRAFGSLDPEERKRVSEEIEEGYRRAFRRANFEEILRLLRAFFHVE